MLRTILLVVALATLSQASDISQAGCQHGWFRFASVPRYCYLFVENGVTWFEASEYCRLQGGHLADPNNNAEFAALQWYSTHQADVKSLVGTSNPGYWVAANDMRKEGVWESAATKQVLKYTVWHNKQPDGKHRENCAHMARKWSYRYGDISCRAVSAVICQRQYKYQ